MDSSARSHTAPALRARPRVRTSPNNPQTPLHCAGRPATRAAAQRVVEGAVRSARVATRTTVTMCIASRTSSSRRRANVGGPHRWPADPGAAPWCHACAITMPHAGGGAAGGAGCACAAADPTCSPPATRRRVVRWQYGGITLYSAPMGHAASAGNGGLRRQRVHATPAARARLGINRARRCPLPCCISGWGRGL
jgi:hypothetical protein